MSAITETAPGGEMVCILDFEALPRSRCGQSVAVQRRAFSTGEHVRYLGHFFMGTPEDKPTGYIATFHPLNSPVEGPYGAPESYFVSLDCWERLKRHFASQPAAH